MLARIYKPTKTTMQSGRSLGHEWVMDYVPATARHPDPLTGWTSSDDMNAQLRLAFDTQEEAVAYAHRHGIAFEVTTPSERRVIIKAYADNFAFGRKQPWSH